MGDEKIFDYLFEKHVNRPGWYKGEIGDVIDHKGLLKIRLKNVEQVSWDTETIPKEKEIKVVTKEQLASNKFYVGSNSIFSRGGKGWGHATVEEAIAHAQNLLMTNENATECFIVEIVKVVKRKPIAVDIEDV